MRHVRSGEPSASLEADENDLSFTCQGPFILLDVAEYKFNVMKMSWSLCYEFAISLPPKTPDNLCIL